MKKFMTIAMIILAAAMLVVSCEAEKKADVDHSVKVNASIGVSESKALVAVTSATDAKVKAIEVKITPMWNTLKTEEAPYYGNQGDANSVITKTTSTDAGFTLSSTSVNLGFISQGLWKVEVKAYNEENGTQIYGGEGTFFFTENAKSHAVVLSEFVSDKTQKFNFAEIKTPAYIDGTTYSLFVIVDGKAETTYEYTRTTSTDYVKLTTATDYSSAATYYTAAGEKITSATDAANWNTYYVPNTSATDWTWTGPTAADLKVGSHQYEVVLRNDTETDTEVGGVAGTFYIAVGNDTTTIGGDLAKSDFTKSQITFVVEGYTVVANTTTQSGAVAKNADITYTATVTSETGSVDVSKLDWYLDGVKVDDAHGSTTFSYKRNVQKPGYHHINAVYDGKASSNNMIKLVPADNE